MIAIVNVGPQTDDPGGKRNYEVKINSKVITKFTHCRRDGLGICLLKASIAVLKKDKEYKEDVIKQSNIWNRCTKSL